MSSFDEHLRYGWISHLGVSVVVLISIISLGYEFELAIAIIGISLPISLGASVLPDIDHHASNTNSLFKYGLFLGTSSLIAVTLSQFPLTSGLLWLSITNSVSVIILFLALSLISVSVGAGVTKLFDIFRPVHRGITHSIGFSVFVSLIVGLSVWHFTNVATDTGFEVEAGLIFALYTLVSVISHLYADDALFSGEPKSIADVSGKL